MPLNSHTQALFRRNVTTFRQNHCDRTVSCFDRITDTRPAYTRTLRGNNLTCTGLNGSGLTIGTLLRTNSHCSRRNAGTKLSQIGRTLRRLTTHRGKLQNATRRTHTWATAECFINETKTIQFTTTNPTPRPNK